VCWLRGSAERQPRVKCHAGLWSGVAAGGDTVWVSVKSSSSSSSIIIPDRRAQGPSLTLTLTLTLKKQKRPVLTHSTHARTHSTTTPEQQEIAFVAIYSTGMSCPGESSHDLVPPPPTSPPLPAAGSANLGIGKNVGTRCCDRGKIIPQPMGTPRCSTPSVVWAGSVPNHMGCHLGSGHTAALALFDQRRTFSLS
jgi:hypothetical protein